MEFRPCIDIHNGSVKQIVGGSLKDKAFNDAHAVFTEHPDTHVRFAGYSIPEISAVEEKALALHARIPQLGVVNWDMTVNSHGGGGSCRS